MTQQRKTQDEEEFDNCFDANGRLKNFDANGRPITRLRVPIRMIDSADDLPQGKGKSTQDAARGYARARQLQDRCPGFTPSSSLRTAKLNALYDARDAVTSSAWKNPPTGVGSHGLAGSQINDICTVRRGGGRFGPEGAAGTIQLIEGNLECVASGHEVSAPRTDALTHDARDVAYQQYDEALREQFRRAR